MRTITVGRDNSCDIVINDQRVSRVHANIINQNGSYIYRDMSTNGTLINGTMLRRSDINIKYGDSVLLASTIILPWHKIEVLLPLYDSNSYLRYSKNQNIQNETNNNTENLPGFRYYLKCFNHYANFSGRARRKEYWYFVLFNILFSLIPILGWIYIFIAFIPGLAVTVRRLHDTGKSGVNLLWMCLPIVGGIILFIFYVEDSNSGINKWGKSPK